MAKKLKTKWIDPVSVWCIDENRQWITPKPGQVGVVGTISGVVNQDGTPDPLPGCYKLIHWQPFKDGCWMSFDCFPRPVFFRIIAKGNAFRESEYELLHYACGENITSLPNLKAFLLAEYNIPNLDDLDARDIFSMVQRAKKKQEYEKVRPNETHKTDSNPSKLITLAVAEQWFKVSRPTLIRAISRGPDKPRGLKSYPDENGYHRVILDDVARIWPRREPPQK